MSWTGSAPCWRKNERDYVCYSKPFRSPSFPFNSCSEVLFLLLCPSILLDSSYPSFILLALWIGFLNRNFPSLTHASWDSAFTGTFTFRDNPVQERSNSKDMEKVEGRRLIKECCWLDNHTEHTSYTVLSGLLETLTRTETFYLLS